MIAFACIDLKETMGPKNGNDNKEHEEDFPTTRGDDVNHNTTTDTTNNNKDTDNNKDDDDKTNNKKTTIEELQDEIAGLEAEAYSTKSKLLNESQFSELLGLQSEDEPEFIEEIIEMYTADARSMLEELKKFYSAKDDEIDFDQIRGTLHKLKGSSSTFGADGVTEMCDLMRELCIEKNVKDARIGPNSLVELEKRVEDLASFLDRYMSKLRELTAAKM